MKNVLSRFCFGSDGRGGATYRALVLSLFLVGMTGAVAQDAGGNVHAELLDSPILFVKRLNYLGIHIYDTYYKWRPGGGIYVLENPTAPTAQQRVRAVIDATTPETLGEGIYSEPDLSWDAKRVLFCFKPAANGSTSIYEIGIDGKGLRRISDPEPCCASYKGGHSGHHDVGPAYLPDGRIVFTSTRPSGLVPCANIGVDIMHVMNADGTDMHPISVNNVNEFDPSVMEDGRLAFGRWEYVDKTALTQQSLWTVFPDGTNETALFANNMVHPEALLDVRQVPGFPHLIVATFTPHNAPPRGTVAFVDTRLGKNSPDAITNLDTPGNPTHDRGNSCEPWPLSDECVLYSGQAKGQKLNAIMTVDRQGRRTIVYADPKIDCHSPIPLRPRRCPPAIPSSTLADTRTGCLAVQDVYEGLTGVKRGDVKWLRVVEETSRVSATPGGAFNQTFLVSAVLAFTVKNFLGIVPVEEDGSAYFEVPSGRAVYLQALDADGRLVQSMRTFVQAAPGTIRSCVGCHEHKYTAAAHKGRPKARLRGPHKLQPESWGSGYVDYPSMVQPVLDKHCVTCHGGGKGIAAGLDLSGGWTEHFNISYENLVARRNTQVTAHLISGIDCMNGTANWSAQIFPPRSHGSGSAPLAELLVNGHKGRIKSLPRAERDLLLAWIDTNGLYHGTWDYTTHGCKIRSWGKTKGELIGRMQAAGCMTCHAKSGKPVLFEDDWINLGEPDMSRILRAPLAVEGDGYGLAFCRDRKVDPGRQRTSFLKDGRYHHGVQSVESFRIAYKPPDRSGTPVVSFASTDDEHYKAMLDIIRAGQRDALNVPRADMPGADVIAGECRTFIPPPIPEPLPSLDCTTDGDGIIRLSWERSARTIGLKAEVHRFPDSQSVPTEESLIAATTLFSCTDKEAQPGTQHYALVLESDGTKSAPIRATVLVPPPAPPPAPSDLVARALPGRVELRWQEPAAANVAYNVYATTDDGGETKLNAEPLRTLSFVDCNGIEGKQRTYTVRSLSKRDVESQSSNTASAAPLPEVKEPLFAADFAETADASLFGEETAAAKLHGKATVADSALNLVEAGFAAFAHRPEFDLAKRLSVECRVKIEKTSPMPVILSCGVWRQAGWFLQRIGAGWRWHVGGVDCDGGQPAGGRWTHLLATFDGTACRLYQDGKLVAENAGAAVRTPWPGNLHIGQYSGGPGPQYQVLGKIAGVRIYGRVIGAQEAAELAGQTVPAETR